MAEDSDALDLLVKVERQQQEREFAKTIKLRFKILATVTALSARPLLVASAARTALRLYDMLGFSYEQLKLYSEARQVHSEQLDLSKSNGDLLGQCWAMKWLASSHSWVHQHELALSLFTERAQLLQAVATAMPFTFVKDEIPVALAEVDYRKAVHQREQGRITLQEMHAADPRTQTSLSAAANKRVESATASPAARAAPRENTPTVGSAAAGPLLSEESLEEKVQKKQALLKMLKLKHERLLLLEKQEMLQMQLEELELQEQQRKKDTGKEKARSGAPLSPDNIHVTVPRTER